MIAKRLYAVIKKVENIVDINSIQYQFASGCDLSMFYNERHKRVLRDGSKPSRKYMTITGTSKATATRDLQEPLAMSALRPLGEWRSVCYELPINAGLH